MKWVARIGDRQETVEICPANLPEGVGEDLVSSRGSDPVNPPEVVGEDLAPSRGPGRVDSANHFTVHVGDEVLDLDVGAGFGAPTPTQPVRAQPPPLRSDAGLEVSIIHRGRQAEVSVHRLSKSRYLVSIDGRPHEVTVDDQLGFLTREADAARGGKGGTVTAYMPGKVAAVLVEEGAEVSAGEGVVVLEAMKMENEIQADIDGVVSAIHVDQGQAVEGGDPLFELTPKQSS